MYEATNVLRYLRQSTIREIQRKWGRKLICYVSGNRAEIDRDDIVGFGDLLQNVEPGNALDLLIHTGGGDIDASEKLILMLRSAVGDGQLRVIVPDYAKSAGTLIAIGADSIVMSDSSELGPIDPQLVWYDRSGNNPMWHSVRNYLDAYKTFSEELRRNPSNTAAQIMLEKLDPVIFKRYEAIHARARQLAENLLRSGMFRSGQGNITKTASDLLDTDIWPDHGQVIDWHAAVRMELVVVYLSPKSEEWQDYWRLYCLQRLGIEKNQKLFESDCVSLPFEQS